jgi:hypothetical protein
MIKHYWEKLLRRIEERGERCAANEQFLVFLTRLLFDANNNTI